MIFTKVVYITIIFEIIKWTQKNIIFDRFKN